MIADILSAVFDTAAEVVTGLATLFGDIIGLVYDSATPGLTEFGTLVILVAAVPLAWNILSYFVNLFKKATKVK